MAELLAFGPRELLLLAASLVAVYLLILLARLRRGPGPSSPMEVDATPSRAADNAVRVDVLPEPNLPSDEPGESAFARELAQSALGMELQQLRRETVELRAEVDRLDEEMRQLKTTHNVSPVYSEAMSMANRGELPARIAACCGISIGEAELVVALAQRESGVANDGEAAYRDNEP